MTGARVCSERPEKDALKLAAVIVLMVAVCFGVVTSFV